MAYLKEKVVVGKTTTNKLYEIINRIQDAIAQNASFRGNATEQELEEIKAQHLAGTYEPALVPGDIFNVVTDDNPTGDMANYVWNGEDWDKTSITFKVNNGLVTDPSGGLNALQAEPSFVPADNDNKLLRFTTNGVVGTDSNVIKLLEVGADITPTVSARAGYGYELELPAGYKPLSVLNSDGIFTPLFDTVVDNGSTIVLVVGDGTTPCDVKNVLAVKVEL